MSKGEETRAAILERALEVASEVGLEGLSIGSLAKEVGMSKSGLFSHFDSKENLQLEVLETAVERFVSTVISPALREPRGEPRIRAIFESWLDWSQQLSGGCPFVSAANEMDDRPGLVRDRLVAYQQDWIEGLTTAARAAVQEGHFRSDLDPEQFAYDFYSIELAYQHFHRLMRDSASEARARRSFERLLESCRPT
ncbi:MAG: TetR/AcrR family transcriptional regulator [Acidobacteria bacterium]|nr:TetR/AcrR family transcriptional regulator [Acidobacteriota bacterium]